MNLNPSLLQPCMQLQHTACTKVSILSLFFHISSEIPEQTSFAGTSMVLNLSTVCNGLASLPNEGGILADARIGRLPSTQSMIANISLDTIGHEIFYRWSEQGQILFFRRRADSKIRYLT